MILILLTVIAVLTACVNPLAVKIDEDIAAYKPHLIIKQGSIVISENDGICDFGNVIISESSQVEIILENTGGSVLTLTGEPLVEIEEEDNSPFSIETLPTQSVQPNDSTVLEISFVPPNLGLYTTNISIKSNDVVNSNFSFKLQGIGIAKPVPDIVVEYDGSVITDGGTSDAFNSAVQNVPLDVEYTILNQGSVNLVLDDISPIQFSGTDQDLFSILHEPGNLVILPDSSTTFTVQFIQDLPGTKSAKIMIYSNDPIHNPYEYNVTNVALPDINVRRGTTDIDSGTGSYNFGSSEYGSPVDVDLTIENLGNAELDLTLPITPLGDDFTVINQPSATITPGGTSTLTLRFDPKVIGECAGSITIVNSDEDEDEYTFDLTAITFLPITERRISAGSYYNVVVKHDGTVWSCGQNTKGQLGLGTTDSDAHYDFSQIQSLSNIVSVSTGPDHCLALDMDGNVWAWGKNNSGQIGNGSESETPVTVPVQVTGLTDVVDIAAGYYNSFALKSDGSVWGWGDNGLADYLGVGDVDFHQLIPAQVLSVINVTEISAGAAHCLALTTDGSVWSWGTNDMGQIGDGTTTLKSIPEKIDSLNDIIDISAAYHQSFALESDGTIQSWGWNNNSQLGDGTTTNRLSPISVPGITDVSAIAAAGSHTTVLKNDGTVWSWGYNQYGQLGDESYTDSTSPVQATGLAGCNGCFGWVPYFSFK